MDHAFDGVYFQILVMGLVKDAPHPNAALLFMNFLLEEQMQTAIAKHDDVPVVQGVASPVDIKPGSSLGARLVTGGQLPLDGGDVQVRPANSGAMTHAAPPIEQSGGSDGCVVPVARRRFGVFPSC